VENEEGMSLSWVEGPGRMLAEGVVGVLWFLMSAAEGEEEEGVEEVGLSMKE
jgi:hypothetical protein